MQKRYVFMLIVALVFSCCFGVVHPAQSQQSSEAGRKVIRKVQPHYPEMARRMSLGGTVKLVATVSPEGNVKKIEPLGGHPLLVEAAESAISQWKFAAGSESRETVELHFTP